MAALGVKPLSEASTAVQGESNLVTAQLITAQWTTLRKKIDNDHQKKPLTSVFGVPVKRGTIYRWGLAAARGESCDNATQWLSRLAAGVGTGGRPFAEIDLDQQICQFQESLDCRQSDLSTAGDALLWAAAMPRLMKHLEEPRWWSLLGAIQDFRDGLLHRDPTQPAMLIGVVEIGMTLAWGLRSLPSCRRLAASSRTALQKWCEQDDLAISAILNQPQELRMVLASLLRIRKLMQVVTPENRSAKKQKRNAKQHRKKNKNGFELQLDEIGVELATWTTALTRPGGSQAFADVTPDQVRDDVGPLGLLQHAAALDPEALGPAMQASLGKGTCNRRLAWQVSLPESMMHDEDAKLAFMMPEWDVRRGRMAIDYSGPTMRLEMAAGKSTLFRGACETDVLVDGRCLQPSGDWVATCEYTDDDVHYLEFEQPHEDGFVLQRQLMLIREDRCCLFADAVIEASFGTGQDTPDRDAIDEDPAAPLIEYQVRLPLDEAIEAHPEPDTNDLFLGADPRRALVMPLSAGEWRRSPAGATATQLQVTRDQHLLLNSRGRGQLYVPLWLDLSRQRFSKKRTWRQLTIGQQLKLVPPRLAAAFRVQVGSSQWILYRSMAPSAPRTFMGKHLIADFYCARFDAKQESYEDLITVEDDPN